ncbi:MAG: hypothetical protein Q9192_001678 [Flavoplaca navasiana]
MALDAATQGHEDLDDVDPIEGFPLNSFRDAIPSSERRAQVMSPVTLDGLDFSSESEASPVSSPTLATITMKSHPSLAAQNIDPNNFPADPPASPPTSAKATKASPSRFASQSVDADSVPADHIDDSRNDGSASPKQRRVGYGGYHPLWRPLPYGGVVPRSQHNIQDDDSSLGSTAPTQTENPRHQISPDEDTELPARYNGQARGSVLQSNIRKHARPGSIESLDSWPLEKTLKLDQDFKSMVRTTLPQQSPRLRMLNLFRTSISPSKRGTASSARQYSTIRKESAKAQSQKNPPKTTILSSTAPTKRSAQEVDDLFHATEEQGPRRSKRKLEKDAQKASGTRADALRALRHKRAARSTHPNTESSITGTKVAKPAPAWDSAALRTIGNFRDQDGQEWVYVQGAWWPMR